jgi:hypothetical protein
VAEVEAVVVAVEWLAHLCRWRMGQSSSLRGTMEMWRSPISDVVQVASRVTIRRKQRLEHGRSRLRRWSLLMMMQ